MLILARARHNAMNYADAPDLKGNEGALKFQTKVLHVLRCMENRIETIEEQQHYKWVKTLSAIRNIQKQQKAMSQAQLPHAGGIGALATAFHKSRRRRASVDSGLHSASQGAMASLSSTGTQGAVGLCRTPFEHASDVCACVLVSESVRARARACACVQAMPINVYVCVRPTL